MPFLWTLCTFAEIAAGAGMAAGKRHRVRRSSGGIGWRFIHLTGFWPGCAVLGRVKALRCVYNGRDEWRDIDRLFADGGGGGQRPFVGQMLPFVGWRAAGLAKLPKLVSPSTFTGEIRKMAPQPKKKPEQPAGNNAPATRAEIKVATLTTKTELRDDIHNLDRKMDVGFAALDRKIDDTKAELKDDIHNLRDELKGDIHNTRGELKGDIHNLRDELKGDIHRLDKKIDDTKAELKGDIHNLRDELKGDIHKLDRKMDAVRVELSDKIMESERRTTRMMFATAVGICVVTIGAMFGMLQYMM